MATVHLVAHDTCSWGTGRLHRGGYCQSGILKGEDDSPVEKKKMTHSEGSMC